MADKTFFEENGYVKVDHLLTPEEVSYFCTLYDDFLNERIATGDHRSDLSGTTGQDARGRERITQIMRPSLLIEGLDQSILHQKAGAIARQLLGEDMDLDFDMLIDKAPFSDAPTPWHQDEAYWLDMPDKRAVSCWIALDESTIDNGCMWFVPGSHHQGIRPHRQTGQGGALQCEALEAEALPVPLQPGACTFHHGRTLHYARGNTTATHRRAFIVNFRPGAMIAYERERGYNHLGNREVRNEGAKSAN